MKKYYFIESIILFMSYVEFSFQLEFKLPVHVINAYTKYMSSTLDFLILFHF